MSQLNYVSTAFFQQAFSLHTVSTFLFSQAICNILANDGELTSKCYCASNVHHCSDMRGSVDSEISLTCGNVHALCECAVHAFSKRVVLTVT